MFYSLFSVFIAIGLFLGMLLLIEIGRRAGIRRASDDAEGARAGLGAIDAAVYSLLGLLIAFTFSGAAMRFDARRQLAIQEANNIGTAWLCIDVLPVAAQADLREQFRQYLDARLSVARQMPDLEAVKGALQRCSDLQDAIWTKSVAACGESASPLAAMLLLPALNQMIDIVTTRTATAQIHPSWIIFATLLALSLASALLAGYGMAAARRRSWMHTLGLAAAVSAAVFVIVDLEYPRIGLIRIDAMDQVLVDLRQSMNKPL